MLVRSEDTLRRHRASSTFEISKVQKKTRRPSRKRAALIRLTQSLEDLRLIRSPSGERSRIIANSARLRRGQYSLPRTSSIVIAVLSEPVCAPVHRSKITKERYISLQ